MPTQTPPLVAVTLPGVYVSHTVIEQIDQALAALYGLIEAAIQLLEDEVPDGPERSLICAGLVTWFFTLYHILNNARLLLHTAFGAIASEHASWHRPNS